MSDQETPRQTRPLSEANATYIADLLAEAYPAGIPEYLFDSSDDRRHKLHSAAPAYIDDLLADRAAFRAAVAQQLAGLRATAEDLCVCGSHFQPEDIDAAAALGLTLP